jgi:cell fate regulator YaaT (PSP1 superfamily)
VAAGTDQPPIKELRTIQHIIRKATQEEVNTIPAKTARERAALQLCQAKAKEMGLAMEITASEFQFDGKKITFYYSAGRYVDFRGLVRSLFGVFGTRIWMVWYDGGAPVRDVYSRGAEMEE